MKIIKGFVTINAFIDQTASVAVLGELSSWSRSYSLEKGEYQFDALPNYKLVTFKTVEDTDGSNLILNNTQVGLIINVANAMMSYAQNHIRPYDPTDFENTVLASFSGQISDLQFGNYADNGSLALPEWYSFTSVNDNNAFVKIWLSDSAFQDQYDEGLIVVIPPIPVLDNFFGLYNNVVNELATNDLSVIATRIQDAKGVYPENYLRVLKFDFINTFYPSQTTPTQWSVLIYGKAPDNVDSIKDAIVQYVLENSTHTKTQWEALLPDLFKRTEFLFIPRWDKQAVPNLTVTSGIYKDMMDPLECLTFVKNMIDFYPANFIDQNTTIMSYPYKGLTLVAINGDSNIAGKQRLDALYPDYISVFPPNPDFSRMQIPTRNWVIFMELLIMTAENATVFSSVPSTLRKQVRDGLLLISGLHENVNYLVAARSNAVFN